ncbi:MAG TPA: methyltransferase [Bryobacteraceae bacterium]|nr:methyltransferase [Bryobacteraceae bacterium]
MSLTNLQLILIALLFLCLASFTWATRKFFVKPDGMTTGLSITLGTGFVFSIVHFVVLFRTPGIQPRWAAAAAALYLAALALFWWTFAANRRRPLSACFSKTEHLHLVQHGPYRFVRHPFYCSYLLSWLAGAVGTLNPMLFLTFFAMLTLYWTAARNEEGKFAASALAKEYSVYRSSTGRFVPRPVRFLSHRRSQ